MEIILITEHNILHSNIPDVLAVWDWMSFEPQIVVEMF